jgi:hypothetical protein
MDRVKNAFGNIAIKRDLMHFYSHQNIINIIDFCEKRKIRILGIDGFFLTPTTLQPSQDNSIDFSHLKDLCINESREFMARMPQNIFYEIVTED